MTISLDLLTFPFDDERWVTKFVIGGFLSLIGGVGWILVLPLAALMPVYGYMARIMRAAIAGDEPALPEWDDWGGLFRDGIRVFAVYFAYWLPVTVILCVAYGVFFIPFIASAVTGSDPEAYLPFLFVGYAGFFMGFACLTFLVLPLIFLSTAAITRMVAHDSLRAAFEFSAVWSLARRGFRHYLMGLIVIFGLLMIAYIVTLALTYSVVLYCIVPFLYAFITIYLIALIGALFGKAYYETNLESPDAGPAPAA